MVLAIIQARMGSARLPGKVLMDLAGETVLSRVTGRVCRARLIDEILVATTDHVADDAIVDECRLRSVAFFRGSEDDVLDRYFKAAKSSNADVVVRITSDCPLIDPEITDITIRAFLEQGPDYASNALVRTYPRGLDTEVITMGALERSWGLAAEPHQRAHVTPYIYEHAQEFKILSVTGDTDHSDHRWTLDTREDLEFIRAIYRRMRGKENFGWQEILTLLEHEPELMELNRSVVQKALHQG